MNKIRIIAFYLPQFHPTPENDLWWGKGFTEWTNVAKARPLFKNHYQPHIPADLGFYDLRLPENREAQAKMALQYGVEGFCYWHYWFGNGKVLLERPFEEVLRSGKPDFPFCLAWANHSWQRKLWNYDKKGDFMLLEQTYPGEEDIVNHFHYVLPAFKDSRYLTVDGKPLFSVFAPLDYPEVSHFIKLWRKLAQDNGLKGIYFVAQGKIADKDRALSLGFDAFNDTSLLNIIKQTSFLRRYVAKGLSLTFKRPIVFKYAEAMKYWNMEGCSNLDVIPSIYPNWDHTPRSGYRGVVLKDSSPVLFKKHVKQTCRLVKDKPETNRIVFLKSWNEWGEGNYMEPDLKYGCKYLEALKEALDEV